MRYFAAVLAVLLAVTALPAEAEIYNRKAQRRQAMTTSGASLAYGCGFDGAQTLVFDVGDDVTTYHAALDQNAVAQLRGGAVKSFSVSPDDMGSSMVCTTVNDKTDCQPQALQLNITSLFINSGAPLEGTISGSGGVKSFSATMPTDSAPCH